MLAFLFVDSRKFDAEDLRLLQSLGRFASAGIDVTTIRQRGQFELRTWTDTHLRDGEFNQDKTLALFEAVVKNSKEHGFALIRFVTHMEWASENRRAWVSLRLLALSPRNEKWETLLLDRVV
jgi:MEDS: MEthanogen/methylotroph, DcmR Sensory domain